MSTGPDLVVVGDCNPDLIVSGSDTVPEFGQHEKLVDSASLVLGGSGAITAVQAAKLGVSTAFVGMVGDDLLGEWCLAQLAASGVDASGCHTVPGVGTGITVVLSGGETALDRAMLTFPGAVGYLEASRVRTDLVTGARHLHFSAYFLQPLLMPGLPVLAGAARRRGATTSLDPNWDPSGGWDSEITNAVSSVDFLFVNREEVNRIARATGVEQFEELGKGRTALVVKNGAEGALLISGPLSRAVSYPLAPGETVADSTGAGDSFDAGFIAGLLAGLSEAESLMLGCYCGARVVTGVGGTANQPNAEDVWDDLGWEL